MVWLVIGVSNKENMYRIICHKIQYKCYPFILVQITKVQEVIDNMVYEVHSTIIFPGSWVFDFAGNSRARKLKAKTKQANITGVMLQYNLRGSKWSGVNFVLSFFLLFLCTNSHLFSPYVVEVSCRHCRNPPLQSRAQ